MTTETLTLTDFLLARIAEDEEGAWEIHHQYDCDDRFPCVCGVPDRIKAECEAKRRIVELAESVTNMHYVWEKVEALLALPYADHPDYREEWRP